MMQKPENQYEFVQKQLKLTHNIRTQTNYSMCFTAASQEKLKVFLRLKSMQKEYKKNIVQTVLGRKILIKNH